MTDIGPDKRQQLLEQWLSSIVNETVSGVSASSDASFRRYFRYQLKSRSVIAMDAPPETEDCRPFVKVAGILAAAGICVPDIIEQDIERGFLLLSDLGVETYLDVMDAPGFTLQQAEPMFIAAIDTLIRMQQLCKPDSIPAYDRALLQRELDLFVDWYLVRHLGLEIDAALRRLIDRLFRQIIDQVLAQEKIFVHRDFMPRNLMVCSTGVPGVLDFQDAVRGPISYDAISLFKDAFISWPENKVEYWLGIYWKNAQKSKLPVPGQFEQFQVDCDFMGVQRHLKILGIFSRICHRDGKPRYLEDVPRFLSYLKTVADRREELSALSELLQFLVSRGVNIEEQKESISV